MHTTSVPLYWRLQKSKYGLVGSKCLTCNTHFYPPKPLCSDCRRKGKIAEHQFSGKGKILTFTIIRTAPEGFEKQSPYAIGIIELEEGPKIAAQIVGPFEKLSTGKNVRPVFRRIYEDGDDGIIHYGIKFVVHGNSK